MKNYNSVFVGNQSKISISPCKIKHTQSISTTTDSLQTKSHHRSISSSLIDNIKQNFDNSKCVGQNQSMLLCCNPKCQENAIICTMRRCICKQKHKRCFTTQIDSFLEKYQIKVQNEKKFIQEINQFFDKLIDNISQYRQTMLKNMKDVYINQNQANFMKMIKDEQFQSLKGKNLACIFTNLDIDEQMKKQNEKINQLLNHLKVVGQQSTQIFIQFQQQYKKWKQDRIQESNNHFNFQSLKIKNIDTKILETNQEVITLRSFFNKKSVKKLNLLYRASQNDFLTNAFYQKCSNIPNTLIVIKTNHDKIIGGFTPLPWKKYQASSYQLNDPSRQSFLFSISEQDKLTLESPEYATYYLDSSPGPRFGKNGYADLWICNKANTSNLSYIFGYMAYQNKNYEQSPQSYQKFLGGQNQYFKTKQWEVFEVLFE